MDLNKNFKNAIRDLLWLLNKGYPKKSSVEIVGNRYRLSSDERMMLYRGVFGYDECRSRIKKLINPVGVLSHHLIIDGLNQFITVISYLKGKTVFRALDGYTRDISGVYGNFKFDNLAERVVGLLKEYLESGRLAPDSITIYLDYSVSRTGDFASYIREVLKGCGIPLNVVVSKKSDHLILEEAVSEGRKCIIATSDTAIIDRYTRILDLAGSIIIKVLEGTLPDLSSIAGLNFGVVDP